MSIFSARATGTISYTIIVKSNYTLKSALQESKASIKDEMKSVFTFINVFNSLKKEPANKYILNLLGVKKLTINELYAYNVEGTYRFQKLQDVTKRLNCEWMDTQASLGTYVRIGCKLYQAVPVTTLKDGSTSYSEFFKSLESACMIAEERLHTQEELTRVFTQGRKSAKMSKFDRILAELKKKYSDMEPSMLEAIAAKAAAAAIADEKAA